MLRRWRGRDVWECDEDFGNMRTDQLWLIVDRCGSNMFHTDELFSIWIYYAQYGLIAYLLQSHCVSIAEVGRLRNF